MQKLVGKKSGMTRIFLDNGISIPVTVIYIIDNIIIKILDKLNKNNILIGIKDNSNKKVNKSISGIFKKNNIDLCTKLYEFENYLNKYKKCDIGKSINFDFLNKIEKISVTSFSKGKGFSGVIKRWNFKLQDASHGNSLSHRAPGSIGQNQSPGKVFKGKKMAGHYGDIKVTIKNLNIIKVDINKKILIVKGCIPGPIGGNLIIKS